MLHGAHSHIHSWLNSNSKRPAHDSVEKRRWIWNKWVPKKQPCVGTFRIAQWELTTTIVKCGSVAARCCLIVPGTDPSQMVGRLCVTVLCVLASHEHLEESDSRQLCHDLTVYSRIMEDFVHLWALDNQALLTDTCVAFFKNIAFLCSFGFFRFLGLLDSFWKTLPGVKIFRKLLYSLYIQKIVGFFLIWPALFVWRHPFVYEVFLSDFIS